MLRLTSCKQSSETSERILQCDVYVLEGHSGEVSFQKLSLWELLILQADEEAGRLVPSAYECPPQELSR
jgi:hypothetical protein